MRVMEQRNRLGYSDSVFDPLPAVNCFSVVSHEALQQRLPMTFYILLLLNQEHGVNNERSQSIHSVSHSKRTHRMWLHQKDRRTGKKERKEKGVSRA